AHCRVGIHVAATGQGEMSKLAATNARKYTDRAITQRVGMERRIFDRVPSHFEQQTLLRIHGAGLGLRSSEKCRVEHLQIGQEARPSAWQFLRFRKDRDGRTWIYPSAPPALR